jgi:hypothetical protein
MRLFSAASVAAVALLAWPHSSTLVPGVDGDWAWIAALSMAAEHGPRFGSELIWTYGPLGFLTAGPHVYYDAIGLVGFAYHWILQLLAAATFFFAARRSYPLPVAAMVAFLVVAAAGPILEIALGFAWCALALTRLDGTPRDLLAKLFPTAAGALAGLTLLGKINFGVELTVMAAIAVACQPGARHRDALTFSAALLASVAAGWFATGQSAADIAPYLRYGLETIRGYTAAQGAPSTHAWHYLGALLLFAIPSLIVWQNARNALPRRRWGLSHCGWSMRSQASSRVSCAPTRVMPRSTE